MARRAAALFVILWIAAALLAPWISPFSFSDQNLTTRLEAPSTIHPLGTDDLGRDVFSRLLYGARVSLIVVAAALLLALLLGTTLGIIAGYYGGLVDKFLGRIIDILMALPGILLAITILAYVGRGLIPLVLALTITAWVGYARLCRSVVLSVKTRDFVLAGRAAGASNTRIILHHLLPQTLSVLTVQAAAGAASVMLSEAGLSFLGLGVQPPMPSWGEMLSTGCDYLLEAPYMVVAPGLLLFATVWSLNTLGDASSAGKERVRASLVDTL